MLRTAQSLPLKGFRHWASTPGVSPRRRQSATGPPGSYPDRTLTGRRRRADNRRSPAYTWRPPVCWAHERPRLVAAGTLLNKHEGKYCAGALGIGKGGGRVTGPSEFPDHDS